MRGSVELHERLIIFQTGRDSQPRNKFNYCVFIINVVNLTPYG